MRAVLAETLAEWEELEERIAVANHGLVAEGKQCEACVHRREAPGVGAHARHRRVVVVAPAARLARIAWASVTSGHEFAGQQRPALAA